MTDTWKAARMDAALVAPYWKVIAFTLLYIPVAGFLATLLVFPRVPGLAAELAGRAPAALAGLVLAAAVGLYALSVWVSVRIVTRKEL